MLGAMRRVESILPGCRALALLAASVAVLAGCTWEAAEKAATRRPQDISRDDAARVSKYPSCAKVRKPGMISFNQTVDPMRMITIAGVGDVFTHLHIRKPTYMCAFKNSQGSHRTTPGLINGGGGGRDPNPLTHPPLGGGRPAPDPLPYPFEA